MYDTANQRSIPWLLGLTALALVVGGGLVLGLGTSERDAADELPAAPVRGMADPDASALPTGEDGLAGRPILEVTTEAGGRLPGSTAAVTADGASFTSAPPTVSTIAPPPSTITAPPAADPGLSSTSLPVSDPATSSTTVVVVGPSTTVPLLGDPTTSTTSGPVVVGLTAVEQELAQLTNELRRNPNGPLRREGPVINCDGRVPIDPASGLYQPVGVLTIDAKASVQVAREWSSQLTTNLQHRPQAGIGALQGAGLDVAAAGENIAYHNFPDIAMRHFVGWRESDGHFCNMMDPTFTHVGVGEATRPDGFSFATQNFFSLRTAG